jgi:hypothetical protein
MDRSYTTYAGADVIDQGKSDVTWEEVREMRDYYLEDTDWRAVKDRTMSQAWKDFRTSLRDLPQDNETANDAADNWPVMPDE